MLYGRWLKRVWWVLPIAALWIFGVVSGFGALVDREHLVFWLGAGAGGGVVFAMTLAMDPPQRIENWASGAEGERRTARALRKLPPGWQVLHDVDAKWGNYDHIVVGPIGVFLIETKALAGDLVVDGKTLTARMPEDPDRDWWSNERIANKAISASIDLKRRLSVGRDRPLFVHAVVALWGSFEQKRHDAERVTWVAGKDVVTAITDLANSNPKPVDVEWAIARLKDDSLIERPTSVAPPAT